MPGTPLLTIEREGAYRLEASVEESHLSAIRVGQPVVGDVGWNRPNAGCTGLRNCSRRRRRFPLVHRKDRFTQRTRASIGNLRARIVPDRQPIVVGIPAAAVIDRGQLQSVLVAENGAARTRLITTGRRIKDRIEILSGLTAGDKVIFPVPQGLGDGAPVEVRP